MSANQVQLAALDSAAPTILPPPPPPAMMLYHCHLHRQVMQPRPSCRCNSRAACSQTPSLL